MTIADTPGAPALDRIRATMKELVTIAGPSGYEGKVRQAVEAMISPHVDSMRVDALGNLIASKGAVTNGGRRILLTAHLDEIGIIATHIDGQGFIRFTTIGGLFLRYLPGAHVRFLDGTLGLIGVNLEPGQTRFAPIERMFIDVGATCPQDCPVRIGDLGVFERAMVDTGTRIISKALDNRAGVALLVEVIRTVSDSPHALTCVFTVQEELQRQGAATAAFSNEADIALAVDVTATGDTPDAARMAVSLGMGPAIKVRDQGMMSDSRIVKWMADTAEREGIPHQFEVLEQGTTDAEMLQVARGGVATGCLSLPLRYLHSPAEMVDASDIFQAYRLLSGLMQGKAAF